MKDLVSLGLKYQANKFTILDQRALPHEEKWEVINQPDDMVTAIKELKVRGAPLIGVAAALSLAQYAEGGASKIEFEAAAEKLRNSRPTAVNLMYAIDLLLNYEAEYSTEEVVVKAENLFLEDQELCSQIAQNGASLFSKGDKILTHCNTGGLATVGVGTALGVIQKVHEKDDSIHVYVDETRPLLQGGRLTTWELEKYKIDYTLLCDNMAASLMKEGQVNKVIVGADRIATNGDFANKVGTYNLAVLCRFHNIPFYVAAPYTTLDKNCSDGTKIPIEQRESQEVRRQWAPSESPTYNPAFDVTPAHLVKAWIFDNKVYDFEEIKNGALAQ